MPPRFLRKSSSLEGRIVLVLFLFLVSFLYLTGRIFVIQVIEGFQGDGEVYASASQSVEIILPRRGSILDRNGQVLAQSVDCFRVDLRPREIKPEEKEKVISSLAELLGIPRAEIEEKLAKIDEPFPLSRQIDSEMAEKIKKLSLQGVDVHPSEKRVYPFGPLAAHIIGFVHPDFGSSGREEFFGLEGIEAIFEEDLHGHFGKALQYLGPTGEKLPVPPAEYQVAEDGKDIVLTIDSVIQNITETALENAIQENKAKSGCAIVLDTRSGEILAMTSYPDFDPNNWTSAKKEDLQNVATQFSYEPGSAIKFVVGAACLEEGVVEPETIITDDGPIVIDGNTFSCPPEFGGPHGKQNLYQLFKNSCNVGFIKLGQMLGIERMYKYLKLFSFGSPSSFELPTPSGKVAPKEEWSKSDLAAVSFGYGLEVTPLQLVSAFQIISNDGKYVPPHIVKEIRENGKTIKTFNFTSTRQVISKKTAIQLREDLKGPVEGKIPPGLDQYGVFGKTGTARAWKDGQYTDLNNTTFVGALPADDPRIAILVDINEPQVEFAYAVRVCVPVFMEIATKMVDIMRFPLP